MIDLLALIPFFITLVLDKMEDIKIIGKAGKIIRLVRVLRIMRIFKLVRHFAGLQSLIQTIQDASKELGLLALLVSFTAFLFSIMVYLSEKDSERPWTLFDSLLWAIMTVTAVGSDAQQPITLMGKFFGGFCPLMGVIILSLPIPIVVSSFAENYRTRICRTEVRQRKEDILREERKSADLQIELERL